MSEPISNVTKRTKGNTPDVVATEPEKVPPKVTTFIEGKPAAKRAKKSKVK